MKNIFIGGAWPYANYYLHIGHVAALTPGDVLARYYRACGDNVIYVSGSDCHGTPITERAKKEGKTPEEIATFYHEEFVKTFNNLNFTYDKYSNTMTKEHEEYVQENFLRLLNNGYIYEKEVEQDFCPKCNTFLSDREIVGICPICGGTSTGDQCDVCTSSLNSSDVKNKHCKTCGEATILKKNKHLYFELTKFEGVLRNLIDKNRDRWRKNAIGEAQKYIDMGLVDRASTRQLTWGIPVPVKGYEDKRIYVWIEAVLGYLSVGYEVAKKRGIDFDQFMNDDNKDLYTYYVHGKDNIPFHTTIFPALVSGLNKNYRLPDYIVSSAYVNINNEKMSKSKGNLISANELLEKFESDTIRFYLIFNGPEKNDINCSIEDIAQIHNKFLVGTIGNFVNRNLSFISKKFEGVITKGSIDERIVELTKETYDKAGKYIEKCEFRNALSTIVDYVVAANKYYDEEKPWVLVKEDINKFNDVTYTCTYIMANMANLLNPFIPNCSSKIRHMLNLENKAMWDVCNIDSDIKITELTMLYNRIDD